MSSPSNIHMTKNNNREQRKSRLGSVTSSTPKNQSDLKNIKVKKKDHERFSHDCIKADMNQDEMFKEYQRAYHNLENKEYA